LKQQHRARRLALQCLCCLDVQGQHAGGMVERFLVDSRELPGTIQAARGMVASARGRLSEIDDVLARHARHWDMERLALVDRNILRLATCELFDRSAPCKVVISEALRLAQEFSTLESPRFVNGVLDSVARELGGMDDLGERAGQDERTGQDERASQSGE